MSYNVEDLKDLWAAFKTRAKKTAATAASSSSSNNNSQNVAEERRSFLGALKIWIISYLTLIGYISEKQAQIAHYIDIVEEESFMLKEVFNQIGKFTSALEGEEKLRSFLESIREMNSRTGPELEVIHPFHHFFCFLIFNLIGFGNRKSFLQFILQFTLQLWRLLLSKFPSLHVKRVSC
jgi:hypothetical protein